MLVKIMKQHELLEWKCFKFKGVIRLPFRREPFGKSSLESAPCWAGSRRGRGVSERVLGELGSYCKASGFQPERELTAETSRKIVWTLSSRAFRVFFSRLNTEDRLGNSV